MNDLELLDRYCETCSDFIDPFIFREVQKRGLLWVVNGLPKNPLEAKAVARAKLAKVGKCFGDAEIDHIAHEIKRLEYLRKELNNINMTEPHKIIPVLKEMQVISEFVLEYLKPIRLP